MSAFGTEVKRLLAAKGKDASWLHHQTKISHSTISNWFNNPDDVRPLPDTVVKVAKALGVTVDSLAPSAGYAISWSADDDERTKRRNAIIGTRPRLQKSLDAWDKLSPQHEDVLLSMMESYIATLSLD